MIKQKKQSTLYSVFAYNVVKTTKKENIMNTCQFTATITAIANAVASKLNIEETTLLAALLVQLGDTLATIATQRTICDVIEKANLQETP